VFFAGQAVSLLGTWMQSAGQAWLVWKLTHSTAALGTVGMFTFLPFLILAPQAGTWADRWDRRRLLIWLQVVAMLVAVALAVLVQTDAVEVWQLYVSASVLGVLATLEMASRPVFIGDLAGPQLLRWAIALNSSMTQASRTVGPALAGVVIAAFGIASAFWFNAASFLAVIASLLFVHTVELKERPGDIGRHGVGEALTFLRRTAGLRELIVFSTLLTFFGMSASNVFPAVAVKVLNGQAATLGWLLSSSGAGRRVCGRAAPAQRSAGRPPRRRRHDLVRSNAGSVLVLHVAALVARVSLSQRLGVSGRDHYIGGHVAATRAEGHAGTAAKRAADGHVRDPARRRTRHRLECRAAHRAYRAAPQRATDDRRRRPAARLSQLVTRVATGGRCCRSVAVPATSSLPLRT